MLRPEASGIDDVVLPVSDTTVRHDYGASGATPDSGSVFLKILFDRLCLQALLHSFHLFEVVTDHISTRRPATSYC